MISDLPQDKKIQQQEDLKDEDDDQNFIKKDDAQEGGSKESLIEKLKNIIFPKSHKQRDLDRETGGLEAEESKKISQEDIEDVWDNRSEEVDKMGSTDVFNSTGNRSVLWRKKKEKMDMIKDAMAAAAMVGSKLKGSSSIDSKDVGPERKMSHLERLKNLRLDRSTATDNGITR